MEDLKVKVSKPFYNKHTNERIISWKCSWMKIKSVPSERIFSHCLALTKIRREINKELQDSTLFYGQFFSWWKTSKASPGHILGTAQGRKYGVWNWQMYINLSDPHGADDLTCIIYNSAT